jgi:prolyl-tRNA synthetase
VSPLSITAANASSVVLVLDSALASSDDTFVMHAFSSEKSVALKGTDIAKYLQSTGVKTHTVNFEELKAAAGT